MPYSVVSLVTIVGDPGTIPPTVTMVPALLAKSSIIWNPVIYFVRHNDFRRACLKLLPVCCIWTKFLQCDRSNRLSTSGNTTKQKIINGNIAVRYLCEPRTPQNDEIKYRLVVSLGSRELTLTDGSQSDTKSLLTLKSKCIETNV